MEETNDSSSKIARVYNCFREDRRVLTNALKKSGDISRRIPPSSRLRLTDPDSIDCTLLHVAATRNDKETFDVLLAEGADLRVRNDRGRTVLHCVLDHPNKKEWIDVVLSLYLSLKDPINPRDDVGLSHLHIACAHNRADVVEFLLTNNSVKIDEGVSLDAEKHAGYSCLHFAAEGLHLSVIDLLLKHRANPRVKNARGLTPFHLLLDAKLDDDVP